MLLVKNWQFFHVLILRERGQGNVFYDILERENAFLEFKNNNLRKVNNSDFSKRVSPWFWSKFSNLSMFLFLAK